MMKESIQFADTHASEWLLRTRHNIDMRYNFMMREEEEESREKCEVSHFGGPDNHIITCL